MLNNIFFKGLLLFFSVSSPRFPFCIFLCKENKMICNFYFFFYCNPLPTTSKGLYFLTLLFSPLFSFHRSSSFPLHLSESNCVISLNIFDPPSGVSLQPSLSRKLNLCRPPSRKVLLGSLPPFVFTNILRVSRYRMVGFDITLSLHSSTLLLNWRWACDGSSSVAPASKLFFCKSITEGPVNIRGFPKVATTLSTSFARA